MIPFAVNVSVAVIWLFLSPGPTLATFVVGYLLGFAFLALFGPVLGSGNYVRRCVAAVKFLLLFGREFVLSNLAIAQAVLFRSDESIRPNFVSYDVTGMNLGEILLLTHCISLTPGTTTVEVSADRKTVLIHCFDVEDPDQVRRRITERLRKPMLAFTR